jgi:formylglycine-generating enzyme required for sulfatase activity
VRVLVNYEERVPIVRRSSLYIFVAVGIAVGSAACGKDSSPSPSAAPQAPAEAVPASVIVPGGDVTVGTRIGSGGTTVQVESFRISRAPITVGEWKACVDYGACAPPELTSGACAAIDPDSPTIDGPTFGRGLDDIPVTCVSLSQANEYCEFVHHGHVPTIEELLMAVRGPTVRRFAWGDNRSGCESRWRLSFAHDVTGACCGHECTDPAALRVGVHPAGNSPYGVSDILSAHAELAASAPSSAAPQCRGKTGCVLTGLEPSAIDWILPLGESDEPNGKKSSPYAASFRCAWLGEVTP